MATLAVALTCAPVSAKIPVKSRDVDRLRVTGLTPFNAPLLDDARFTFTAPGRAASTARIDTVERAFRFTPSGNARKGVGIGVTSRVATASADASRGASTADAIAAAPAAYNVGLAIDWRGFAVSGGYSRLDSVLTAAGPNRREAVDVGISYSRKNWKTALQVAAETGSPLLPTPLERRYSVDVGGAYAVGPRLSVSGGVRYKLAPVAPSILDADRADQSVYLGTALSF